MNKNVKEDIEKKLIILKDQPFADLGRSGNLLWLGFGKQVKVKLRNGIIELRNYYALDIQCSWRLTLDNQILIADRDFYIPKDNSYIENFNWDVIGENLFDKKAEKFMSNLEPFMKVTDIHADNFGGFQICFSTGHNLEVFPNDSLREEYWRFIIFDDPSKHFVVFDD